MDMAISLSMSLVSMSLGRVSSFRKLLCLLFKLVGGVMVPTIQRLAFQDS